MTAEVIFQAIEAIAVVVAAGFAGDEFHLDYAMTTTWESMGDTEAREPPVPAHMAHRNWRPKSQCWN